MRSSANDKINIVLDIDYVLATPLEELGLDRFFIQWQKKQRLILNAGMDHILHPGVLEFIRYLYQMPNVRICFFSAGLKERNKDFVEKLLIKALGDERYQEIKDQVSKNIFSRDDCTMLSSVSYKKNLNVILQPEDKLDSTILIDDTRENILPNQTPNGLITLRPVINILDEADDDFALRSSNQIFYVVGLLQKLFSIKSDSISQNLFKLQYKNAGKNAAWLEETGLALLTLSNKEELDSIAHLSEIAKSYDNIPLLIKLGNEFFLFGKPDGTEWKLTKLNKNNIERYIPFPETGEHEKIEHAFLSTTHDKSTLERIIEELNKGHTELTHEPDFNLYNDKSFYLAGLKELQKFNRDLQFYGKNANEYFITEIPKISPPSSPAHYTPQYTFFKPKLASAILGGCAGALAGGIVGTVVGATVGYFAPAAVEELSVRFNKKP